MSFQKDFIEQLAYQRDFQFRFQREYQNRLQWQDQFQPLLQRLLQHERQRQRQRQYDLLTRCQRQLEEFVRTLTSYQEKPSAGDGIGKLFHIRRTSKSVDKSQYIIDLWLDVCIDVIVLEKRMGGALPACEGILIVRELK